MNSLMNQKMVLIPSAELKTLVKRCGLLQHLCSHISINCCTSVLTVDWKNATHILSSLKWSWRASSLQPLTIWLVCQLLLSSHCSQLHRCIRPVYRTPEHLGPPADQPLPCKSQLIYYHWQTATTATTLHFTADNKLPTTCGISSAPQTCLWFVVTLISHASNR